MDRFAQFSVAVAAMALEDAGELDADPGRSGVVMGTGVGGLETLETQILALRREGPPPGVPPARYPMMMSNAGAAAVSIRMGWHGPSETITTACAAGAHSIGHAARLVASGRCDVAIAGAAEAGMTGVGHGRLHQHDRPLDVRGSPGPSTSGGTASSSPRAPAPWSSRPGTTPPPAGRASTASWPGRPAPPTPTTSPPRSRAAPGAAACMTLAMEDAERHARPRSATSTPTAPRPRSTTGPSPTPSPRCSAPARPR